jgi:hypothetical protein
MLFRRKARDEGRAEPSPALVAGDEASAALRDQLGLHHLWYLELRLREELARASRAGGVFSLASWRPRLLPDEAFPLELLRQSAELIAASLRAYDVVARTDELRFAAILLDAGYEDAATVAFRVKAHLQVRIAGGPKWQAGVATFGRDGVDGDALIQTALRRLEEDARA